MADGYLTTHVLDTARGVPATGLEIRLFRLEATARVEIAKKVTNAEGRTDGPILVREQFREGVYEIDFLAGDYFRAQGIDNGSPRFLDVIPIRFGIADVEAHYHVPLLLSPYGYSTYRGS